LPEIPLKKISDMKIIVYACYSVNSFAAFIYSVNSFAAFIL